MKVHGFCQILHPLVTLVLLAWMSICTSCFVALICSVCLGLRALSDALTGPSVEWEVGLGVSKLASKSNCTEVGTTPEYDELGTRQYTATSSHPHARPAPSSPATPHHHRLLLCRRLRWRTGEGKVSPPPPRGSRSPPGQVLSRSFYFLKTRLIRPFPPPFPRIFRSSSRLSTDASPPNKVVGCWASRW